MRTTAVAMSALAVLAAGCGTQHVGQRTAAHSAPRAATAPQAATAQHAAAAAPQVVKVASSTTPGRCRLRDLAVRLGPAGHAAGSTYRPIVFTNTSGAACTLRGYPGVAYVAPSSGAQVGAAASRDAAVTVRTVTLQPGGHAASLLQLVNYLNYPAGSCKAKTVSGLRVYPPGSTTAAYVAFGGTRKACSTDVHQLAVRAVLRGTTGQ